MLLDSHRRCLMLLETRRKLPRRRPLAYKMSSSFPPFIVQLFYILTTRTYQLHSMQTGRPVFRDSTKSIEIVHHQAHKHFEIPQQHTAQHGFLPPLL